MLLLDANILIRAMLGSRVHSLLLKYRSTVEFFAKDSAFLEVHRHLPEVVERRGLPVAPAMHMLDSLAGLVQEVELRTYAPFEDAARQRIERRDEDDWPVVAAALALRCPIWTEDTDLFGCGIAT